MDTALDTKRIGRIFGWFFIGTFVTSIPARLLFVDGLGASWSDMRFVPGAGSTTSLQLGAALELSVILTNVATAVVLYRVVKQSYPTLAIGYVTSRVMESVFIAIGLMSLVSVISVSDAMGAASGADAAALAVQGNSLVATYEWAFLFGPGFFAGFGNGLILGYLMYRTGLLPRRMAMIGLVGGPLIIISFGLILFGVYKNGSGASSLLGLPEIVWEASLAVYCAWKGFKRSPLAD